MGLRLRLRQDQKVLASQAAKRVLALGLTDRAEVRAALRAEGKNVGIDPQLIILFVQIAWAIYKYFTTKNLTPEAANEVGDDYAVLASVRYME